MLYEKKYKESTLINRALQARFQEAAKAALAAQAQDVSIGQQKKKHANLQEKIQGLWSNSKLFEKALTYFKGSFVSKLCHSVHVVSLHSIQILMMYLSCPNTCCEHCALS